MLGALISRIEKFCRNFDITVYIPITSNTREEECGLNVEACRFGGLVLYPGKTPICLHAQKVQAIFFPQAVAKRNFVRWEDYIGTRKYCLEFVVYPVLNNHITSRIESNIWRWRKN